MGRVSMPQGKGSQLHNRREYEKIGKPIPDNIDVSKSSENITLVDKDIKQAYQEIFGEALEKYNAKQKRADRKIEDYCDHIKKSKNGEKLFYEDVVQWGSKEDFQKPETRERAKEALVQYVKGFEERNPNLKLIGAYIHMDEASPHLHLDYIPVAKGYTRGLETRNSLDKAMKQMGYQPEKESRKNNATKLWKENERSVFGEICRNMGLEVEAERKARGSLSVEEYKEVRDQMIGEIEQEKEAIVAEVEPLRELKTGIDEIDTTGTKLPFGVVAIKKKDLEAVKEQAKAYTANRDEIGELRERSAAVSRREQRADQREQHLNNKSDELARQQQQLQQMYQRQLNLNQLLEKSERDGRAKDKQIADLQRENGSLRGQIRSLTAQLDEVKAELWNKINNLTDKLKGAYESLTNVVKAVGMLKYDREKDQNGNYTYGKYGISNLSKAQDKLIDGLAEYGARWAKEDGFPEMAEEMEKRVGISKGGVGKSMTSALLACAMARRGYHCGILDADITGPSIPKLFGIHGRAMADDKGCWPIQSRMGIDVMSINLLVENEEDPVVWRGPVIAGAVKQFWTDVVWKDVDFLFVDMPPGTGDVPLTVFQSLPVDGIVVVASPQELVSMIVAKAVNMAEMMKVPMLGIVENMSYIVCPDCGKHINVFGDSHVGEVAAKHHLPVLAKCPIDPQLAALSDAGMIETYGGQFLEGAADACEKLLK